MTLEKFCIPRFFILNISIITKAELWTKLFFYLDILPRKNPTMFSLFFRINFYILFSLFFFLFFIFFLAFIFFPLKLYLLLKIQNLFTECAICFCSVYMHIFLCFSKISKEWKIAEKSLYLSYVYIYVYADTGVCVCVISPILNLTCLWRPIPSIIWELSED